MPNKLPDLLDEGVRARRDALLIVNRWLRNDAFPDRQMARVQGEHGFVMDLVYGVVRGRRRLEWALAPLLSRRPPTLWVAALLIGAQQLLCMRDVADHAALHATVEALKSIAPGGTGLVNGVLRNLLRRRDSLLEALERQPLALRTSHPELLVDRWTRQFGPDETAALCHWNNQPAETVVIPLPGRGVSADDLLARWANDGLQAHPHPACPQALVLPRAVNPARIAGFDEGLFVLQDPATLAAVELLDARPGQRVLDACAAPGGKTLRLAALMRGDGELIACDRRADRLPRLRENLARTPWRDFVTVRQANAGEAAIERLGRFDRILLDAPCSNTGVLRRRPDARWRFTTPRLQQLVAQQRRLLLRLLPLLAPGGRLVYSTCSLEPEENEDMVASVCTPNGPWQQVDQRASHPGRDATDGAFAAAIGISPAQGAGGN